MANDGQTERKRDDRLSCQGLKWIKAFMTTNTADFGSSPKTNHHHWKWTFSECDENL